MASTEYSTQLYKCAIASSGFYVSLKSHNPVLGLIGLTIATYSSKQRKITMQDKDLCWPPYFSLGPQWTQLFYI